MRNCDGCTACCTSLAVPEYDKKTNDACEHICIGCNIYAERPESCRTFRCTWLSEGTGFKELSMRPDRCGVVAAGGPTDHGIGMYFYEVWEGAIEEERIQLIIEKYNVKFPVLLIPHKGNKGRLFAVGETGQCN